MNRRHRNLRRKPMFAPLLLPIAAFAVVALGIAWFLDSQATTTVILVGHAEPEGGPGSEGPLSEQGRARAELLAHTLMDVDVTRGLDAVYAFPLLAAEQTAEPLAQRLELPVGRVEDVGDLDAAMDAIVDRHKGRIVLVVAEAPLLPELTAALGGHKSTPAVPATDYTNVYVLSIPWFGRTKTLRFYYGLPWPEGVAGPAAP